MDADRSVRSDQREESLNVTPCCHAMASTPTKDFPELKTRFKQFSQNEKTGTGTLLFVVFVTALLSGFAV